MIRLVELNKENYKDILKLKVSPDQEKFVATNAISLAQAHFEDNAWYRGIYADEKAVGFAMLEINTRKPEYYLWRYMIDANEQAKGYGREALKLIIEHVKTLPGAKEFLLSYVPGEGTPAAFYSKLGFEETGEIEDGEIIMRLKL